MASKAEKDLKKFLDNIVDNFGTSAASRKVLKDMGNAAVERIKKRTRLGYGVPSDGAPRRSLKSMRRHSQTYTEWRNKNRTSLAGITSPAKHNLTLTGQMLEKLKVTKVLARKLTVRMGFTDSFAELKADVNTQRGWEFLNISNTEKKFLSNFYRREIRKLVKKKK